jgi:putative DNA methylase
VAEGFGTFVTGIPKRKLIEVAMPVEAISAASRRDKDRKVGTIKNVHKWFAPMPTPAWRALLFAALIDDPGDAERGELIEFVKLLMPDDGTAPGADVLAEAKRRLHDQFGDDIPTVLDPFCGGGSTLVEAQRLGLPTVGSDLNPVPVLITRVLTDLVPKMAGRPPLTVDAAQLSAMAGGPLDGLFADVRHYAARVRERVWAEVGHLYPAAPGGGTLVAWLWARTVNCPNPACRAIAPLVSSFWLSKRQGGQTWIEPIPQGPGKPVTFEIRTGAGAAPAPTKSGRGGNFRCATCADLIPEAHVKEEGVAGRVSVQLMAVAADMSGRREYLPSTGEPSMTSRPDEVPDVLMADYSRWFSPPAYGFVTYADIFTNRQLTMLGAFADAVADVPEWVRADGGDDLAARTITSILGLGVGKLAMAHSTQSRLEAPSGSSNGGIHPAFSRHALPMVWDFSELNPFAERGSNWEDVVKSTLSGMRALPAGSGRSMQGDARTSVIDPPGLVATDPPYFAQIGYADLSDFFYVWHRRALSAVHPDLYATVATPKTAELIAAPHRHDGNVDTATKYFVDGFTETFRSLQKASRPDLPTLVIYAHRQDEKTDEGGNTSSGWDAMLTAIIRAGLRIVGTWPIHATTSKRQIGQGANAIASYVVLVCRPALAGALPVDRAKFLGDLRIELPRAIRHLQQGGISAIDLAQATYGPGMEIFSRYRDVLDPATGQPMTVSQALAVIEQVRSEVLDDFSGSLDRETRWAMAWFGKYGFDEGDYGEADTIFRTTNTSLEGLIRSGIVRTVPSKVALISRNDLPGDWDPATDDRRPVWELTQHLVKQLDAGGDQAAADLLRKALGDADAVRDLAYWLFEKCELSRPGEASKYAMLTSSWPEILKRAHADPTATGKLFDDKRL